jgi:hypothetical protein
MERRSENGIKKRVYLRVAKRDRSVRGNQYVVSLTENPNNMPIMVGSEGRPLRTIHFAFDINIPDSLFREPTMPVVEVQVNADGTFADMLVVVQVPVDVPPEAQAEVDAPDGEIYSLGDQLSNTREEQ